MSTINVFDDMQSKIEAAVKEAVEAEREACAQLAEGSLIKQSIADAIRARRGVPAVGKGLTRHG